MSLFFIMLSIDLVNVERQSKLETRRFHLLWPMLGFWWLSAIVRSHRMWVSMLFCAKWRIICIVFRQLRRTQVINVPETKHFNSSISITFVFIQIWNHLQLTSIALSHSILDFSLTASPCLPIVVWQHEARYASSWSILSLPVSLKRRENSLCGIVACLPTGRILLEHADQRHCFWVDRFEHGLKVLLLLTLEILLHQFLILVL